MSFVILPAQAPATNQLPIRLIGITAIALLLQFVSMFLPWFQIGERKRSSFEVLDAAITFSPSFNTVAALVEAGWIMLPALGATSILLWVAGFQKLGRVGSQVVVFAFALFGLFSVYFSSIKVGSGLCVAAAIGYIICFAIAKRTNKLRL